jgi:hypothetical protein
MSRCRGASMLIVLWIGCRQYMADLQGFTCTNHMAREMARNCTHGF